MERLTRSSSFWVVLAVALMVPASLLATKQLFVAQISDGGGAGVGSSALIVNTGRYSYIASTRTLDNKVVKSVWLSGPCNDPVVCVDPVTGPFTEFKLLLCDGADEGEDDDCTYNTVAKPGVNVGNIYLEGNIEPASLMAAHITGRIFSQALTGAALRINLADANGVGLGSGVYVQMVF